VYGVVYRVGIEAVPYSGGDVSAGELGTFARGLHRISGYLYSYHGLAAEELLSIAEPIDLIVGYRANGEKRRRTFSHVLFVGDATVTVPALNRGVSPLIGVPFRVQVAAGSTVGDHVTDEVDS